MKCKKKNGKKKIEHELGVLNGHGRTTLGIKSCTGGVENRNKKIEEKKSNMSSSFEYSW
jgi:hypothetical protein